MSLSLALQLRTYELLSTKRMPSSERASIQQRFVAATSEGVVRGLIRDMEALEDMSADEVEDRWKEIEAEMDLILLQFKDS